MNPLTNASCPTGGIARRTVSSPVRGPSLTGTSNTTTGDGFAHTMCAQLGHLRGYAAVSA